MADDDVMAHLDAALAEMRTAVKAVTAHEVCLLRTDASFALANAISEYLQASDRIGGVTLRDGLDLARLNEDVSAAINQLGELNKLAFDNWIALERVSERFMALHARIAGRAKERPRWVPKVVTPDGAA